MSDDQKDKAAENENIKFEAQAADENAEAELNAEGFPDLDDNMLGQVQDMMQKLERYDELEAENTDLKGKLGRLAADFESYRNRTQQDAAEAQSKGVSKAAQALMPVYDDISRALSMGIDDPTKLIPGMQAVQSKVLSIFSALGLEATGKEGEAFDPAFHEAIQVVDGEDGKIIQTYELGFKMNGQSVRPARVVVGQKS